MERNHADRAWMIRGQVAIGDDGLPATPCPWPEVGGADLEGDRLSEHLNPHSECWFAPERSADLWLVER